MHGEYFSKGGRLLTPYESSGELSKDKAARYSSAWNVWTASQYNSNNAWNFNGGSLNNNNKTNNNSAVAFFELYDDARIRYDY